MEGNIPRWFCEHSDVAVKASVVLSVGAADVSVHLLYMYFFQSPRTIFFFVYFPFL